MQDSTSTEQNNIESETNEKKRNNSKSKMR